MSISSTSSTTTSTTTSTSSSFGYSNLMSAPTSGTTPGPNRITGLATGLDIDSLVKEEMMAKQQPIDKMMQQEQLLSWQRDAYRGINTALSQFQTAAANLRYGFDFQAEKATSDNTSVSVTAGAQAVSGTYTMTVHQLATSASIVSQSGLGLSQNTAQVLNSGQAITLNVTGTSGTKAVSIAANSTINDVINDINAQTGSTGVTASYDTATDRMYLNSTVTGANSLISIAGADSASQSFLTNTLKIAGTNTSTVTGTKSYAANAVVDSSITAGTSDVFSINGTNITVTNTTTIANLQDQIAKAGLSPNVALTQDVSGNLMLQSTGNINIQNVTGTPLTDMGLTAGTTNASSSGSAMATGTDTIVDFNGVNGVHFHTSNFTLNNLTFSLTTPPAAGSSYTADVTVSQDTDTIYNNIKTFITSYNTIVDTLYNKINEPKYYNYPPLTDTQKSQMSANDIDLWNQKAQSGMLQGDSTLQSTLDSLRSFMQDPVNNLGAGNYKMLSDIGITQLAPGTTNAYQDNGHLYINDTQLKQAIQTNPQQVIALFTTVPSSDLTPSTINTPDDNQGISERMYRVITNSMNSITTIAGTAGSLTDNSSLGLQITDLTNQITDADSKLAGYQQQYYSQFAQLESAINNFNSQKQYLSSAFGGGSSSGG